MKRWDAAIIAAGLPTAVVGWLVAETAEGRFIALMTTIGAVLAGVAVNHTIPRAPRLVVRYANPDADDQPMVWNHPDGHTTTLQVLVENRGQGPARAVEVEFDHLGMDMFNASGNPHNRQEVDPLVHPPRFNGGERVLNPGDSPWRIAGLWNINPKRWQAGMKARWKARAHGMEEQTGEVEITVLDGPPS